MIKYAVDKYLLQFIEKNNSSTSNTILFSYKYEIQNNVTRIYYYW